MPRDQKNNEDRLIDALQLGDDKAFSEIYDIYGELVYRNVLKRIDCREDAKDLTQEIFTALWQNREDIRVEKSLGVYLLTAAKYKVINYIAHQNVKQRSLDLLPSFFDNSSDDTDHRVRIRDLSSTIELAIGELPSKMQTIFRMSRQEQLSHKEIAENLGLSESTVKKQVANALRSIRPKIGKFTFFMLIIFNY